MLRIFAFLIVFLFVSQSQAGVTLKGGKLSTSGSETETELSGAATSGGWKEFIPRKGKPDFDGNKIVGCGGSKKSYKILFGGTPENPICQIGVKEPYTKTKKDIEISEYDIHGTMRTKCADALSELPQDIFVNSPTENVGWCPYDHPKVKGFTVKNPNKFIDDLKTIALSTNNRTSSDLFNLIQDAMSVNPKDAPWRKGFTGLYPNHATDAEPSYGKKESRIRALIQDYQSLLITAYLFANEKQRSVIADKVAQTLILYKDNNAFEYLFNTPFSQHIKARDSEGGEGELFDDYSVPGYWDNSATMGLNYFLPGIINFYSIVKSENPMDQRLPEIREYVEKLVWLNEQGIDYGMVNKDAPLVVPESANHHSASRAFIHLLWGISAGDDTFFQAGVNHFVSVIQDSRSDGSISSEVKPSPSEKSSHGGWGSIDRNNETLGYHALGAMLIDSQGYDVDSISINGVNARRNIDFGVAAFFNPSVANKWTKVKNYSAEYKDEAGATTNKNLSWYLLSSLMLDNEPNDKVLQFILENEHQGMATNLGLIDVRYFLPMKEKSMLSNNFDGLTCGYQILKRGFDKEENKNYEYTVNIGRFTVEDGQPKFGKNIWKTGGVTPDEDHMAVSANLFVQEDGTITGMFPVFTATKKKRTKMVEIKRANEGSSLLSTAKPMAEFVALLDGDTEDFQSFIFRVNSCF